MANPFEQIVRFLGHFEEEVQGRDAVRLDDELRGRLDRFARGECTENERAELCRIAVQKPELVGYLARSVKQLRTPASS